jgi:VPDSG-CTERM motif
LFDGFEPDLKRRRSKAENVGNVYIHQTRDKQLEIKYLSNISLRSSRNRLQIQVDLHRTRPKTYELNILIINDKRLSPDAGITLASSTGASMQKILTFALLTMGLVLNAGAQTANFLPPPASVPDPGSTAVLLGLGLAALAVYRKKDQT